MDDQSFRSRTDVRKRVTSDERKFVLVVKISMRSQCEDQRFRTTVLGNNRYRRSRRVRRVHPQQFYFKNEALGGRPEEFFLCDENKNLDPKRHFQTQLIVEIVDLLISSFEGRGLR